MRRLFDITVDYQFETGILGQTPLPFSPSRIRRIANIKSKLIRPICLSHPPRAELEIQAYGREHFVNIAPKMISLPFLCFIDGFGLYRNMYRTLMGVYLTLASQNLRQRTRRANIFPLTLGPHASSLNELMTSIKGLLQLDKGLLLRIRGEEKLVCAYTIAFTGDMPQQQENARFKRQNANRGCRNCLITAEFRHDLTFDTTQGGRFHPHVTQVRQYGEKLTKSKYEKFCSEWGLAENPISSYWYDSCSRHYQEPTSRRRPF